MYWTHCPERSELEGGHVFVHGMTRLNLSPYDLATFVEPPDAALVFGFRALAPEDTFHESFPVWMATLRRREGKDAIVESLQRVFTQLVDEGSLVGLLSGTCDQARSRGYRKLWLAPALHKEPLFVPSLKRVVDATGRPLEMQVTTGLSAIAL